MADVAALVVALSAQLTKFEKDMKDAYAIADKQTKAIETRFSQMNKNIENEFSSFVGRFTAAAGPLGGILGGLGPIGTSIAVGIGAATLAITALSEVTQQYIEKQRAMREMTETTGLTLNELKALAAASRDANVDFDKTERAVNKLSAEIGQLRATGMGPLANVLDTINPKLKEQVITAGSMGEAVSIVAKAIAGLNDEQRQANVTADLFGQKNIQVVRVFKNIADNAGLPQMAANLDKAGKGIDENVNKKLVEADQHLKDTQKDSANTFGSIFAPSQQRAQQQTADIINAIAHGMKDILDYARQMPEHLIPIEQPGPGRETPGAAVREKILSPGLPALQPPPYVLTEPPTVPTDAVDRLNKAFADLEKQYNALHSLSISQEQDYIRQVQLLGAAATPTQKLTAEQYKLNQAVREHPQDAAAAQKAAEEYRRTIDAQTLSERERLGIATLQQEVTVKMNALYAEAARLQLSKNEIDQASLIIQKQIVEQQNQQAIRASNLPQLKTLSIEGANLGKQIDQLATTTFANFENALGSAAAGTTTLADAFKKMTESMISDIVKLTLKLTVTAPLAKAFEGIFGSLFGPNLAGVTTGPNISPNASGQYFGRQGGGPVFSGTPYLIGEHGPELFVPHASGQVVPAGLSKASSSGDLKVTVNNYASGDVETTQQRKNQGTSVEELVIGIVKRTIASGDADASNRARFGLRPNKVR